MNDPIPQQQLDANGKALPKIRCPICNTKMDAATAAVDSTGAVIPDSARPKPGDLTVCFYCAALLQFAPDMTVIPFDILSLDEDTQFQVRRIQIAIQQKGRIKK